MSPSFGLLHLVTEPTHNHHNGSISIIDLVLVSTLRLVDYCVAIPPLGNSNNKGVFGDCHWKLSAQHNCIDHSAGHVVRSYKLADWERAKMLINEFDWNTLLSDDTSVSLSKW